MTGSCAVVSCENVSAASPQLCPSCAGQVVAGAASCQWCGAGLGATEATSVGPAPAPSSRAASRPDIGFGDHAARPLPPLPPPPKSLPLTTLNPTQVMLRTMILLGALYVALVLGQQAMVSLKMAACTVPSPLCR